MEELFIKQYEGLKKKHPDVTLLFRAGDFYETYQKDARECAKVLGTTLVQDKKDCYTAFPHYALDTYLPKMIRAGYRLAICERIEQPQPTIKRRAL